MSLCRRRRVFWNRNVIISVFVMVQFAAVSQWKIHPSSARQLCASIGFLSQDCQIWIFHKIQSTKLVESNPIKQRIFLSLIRKTK